MRKIPIVLLILIVTMSILWIVAGRQISSLVDQFKTAEVISQSLQSISYEGSGDGGAVVIDNHRLTLAPLNPHVGSTKDNQLALAYAGKVFAFGALRSSEKDALAADVPPGDNASLSTQRSCLIWPSLINGALNWNRAEYCTFTWTKHDGAKLKMLWSTGSAKNGTSLIRIDFSNPAR